jgi:hypothetical protein
VAFREFELIGRQADQRQRSGLDIVMQSSAPQVPDRFGAQTFAAPAQIPPGGDWVGSISGYGTTDYFRLPGKANRSLAIEVTSLNEKGAVSQSNAMPAIGIWAMRDTQIPAREFSPFAFNTGVFGPDFECRQRSDRLGGRSQHKYPFVDSDSGS